LAQLLLPLGRLLLLLLCVLLCALASLVLVELLLDLLVELRAVLLDVARLAWRGGAQEARGEASPGSARAVDMAAAV
jgi:hypothetical protein